MRPLQRAGLEGLDDLSWNEPRHQFWSKKMPRNANERVGGASNHGLGVRNFSDRTLESSLQLAISFPELLVRAYQLVLAHSRSPA